MLAQTERLYTVEEYLDFELQSEQRHEYINGEILLMTGGTPEHNEIASILNAILRVGLRGQPYSIFVADQRLWIPDRNLYTYPDVMVAARPLQLQEGRTDTITNPLMIAEVLSKATKGYDPCGICEAARDEKFAAYRTVPTFQEYLLIDQYSPHVEQYSKTDTHQWLFTEYDGLGSHLTLSSLSIGLTLEELYESLQFPA